MLFIICLENLISHYQIYELNFLFFSAVAIVALNKELGCLEPNISEDSIPMQMIENVDALFKALNMTEAGSQTWRIYRSKAYVDLETAHNAFLE